RLGAACDLAAGAGDHDTNRVEQMPARIVAHLLAQRGVAQGADEARDGLGGPGGGMANVKRFGMGHRAPLRKKRSEPSAADTRCPLPHDSPFVPAKAGTQGEALLVY